MSTSRKIDCINKIEQAIRVPEKNYFVKNESSVRLCYFVGALIRYIILPSPLHVAEFLKKHGVIQDFEMHKDGSVSMFTISLHTITGPKGQPVQLALNVSYKWSDIEMSSSQVLHYAAVNEFESTGGLLGIVKQKVFSKKDYRGAA